jgi:hypothetical protein
MSHKVARLACLLLVSVSNVSADEPLPKKSLPEEKRQSMQQFPVTRECR